MMEYNVDDLARSVIAMYLSSALQKDMEKRGFIPIKAGQDPAAMGMPPGMAPPVGMPPIGMPPGAGAPPGAMPLGAAPPPAGPNAPGPDMGAPGGPSPPPPPFGGGDIGSLMGLLGAMPPPPATNEEKREDKKQEEAPAAEEPKEVESRITLPTLYAEIVKVRKLLIGIYDGLKLRIPADTLADEEVYLGTEKEEVRQAPKEKEQLTPVVAQTPPEAEQRPKSEGTSIPPDIKESILGA